MTNCLNQDHGQNYSLYHGDNVEVLHGIPDNSIGYRIFSPPFESLYTYSNSDRDMGNCPDSKTFTDHYRFLIEQQYRTHAPGRLLSFHCQNIPTRKSVDGFIGVRDFRGSLIRLYEEQGWIFHSEVCIWKDPVMAMQRTKALGLLHKQVVKDSAKSRQGIPDYVVTMLKPGLNENPVKGKLEEYYGTDQIPHGGNRSINIWQRYASPVWMDIDQADTLQYRSARDNNDERHVCPLQLGVIRRCIQLWSNEGDVIADDFNGIGSTGYVALQMNRKYVGIELKESYFNAAKTNLQNVSAYSQQQLALVS